MDDTTLFWVVLHLLVVFTEQLFAALVSSGGNSRLAVATLDDGDLIVWTGHLVFLKVEKMLTEDVFSLFVSEFPARLLIKIK